MESTPKYNNVHNKKNYLMIQIIAFMIFIATFPIFYILSPHSYIPMLLYTIAFGVLSLMLEQDYKKQLEKKKNDVRQLESKDDRNSISFEDTELFKKMKD